MKKYKYFTNIEEWYDRFDNCLYFSGNFKNNLFKKMLDLLEKKGYSDNDDDDNYIIVEYCIGNTIMEVSRDEDSDEIISIEKICYNNLKDKEIILRCELWLGLKNEIFSGYLEGEGSLQDVDISIDKMLKHFE